MAGALDGQVGIVTGAGRGIGRATAQALGAAGMHVVAVSRSRAEIEETAELIRAAGGQASAVTVDVRDRASIEACVEGVLATHGKLDLLVNNAGSNAAWGPVWEVDPELWRQDMETNLYAPFLFCRAALRVMVPRRQGRIVNITGGGVSGPLPYDTGYSSSKAGLARFSETISIEARPHGVKVFSLGPGVVATKLAMGFFDSPEGQQGAPGMKDKMSGRWVGPEVAGQVVATLASGRADAVAGLLFTVADDLEQLIRDAEVIRAADQRVLRVVLPAGHLPAVMLKAREET